MAHICDLNMSARAKVKPATAAHGFAFATANITRMANPCGRRDLPDHIAQ
jgi:hypothetical protein